MLDGYKFTEVFPDYKVPEGLRFVLSSTVVERVVLKQKKETTDHTHFK